MAAAKKRLVKLCENWMDGKSIAQLFNIHSNFVYIIYKEENVVRERRVKVL
jgi:hypothetical protein